MSLSNEVIIVEQCLNGPFKSPMLVIKIIAQKSKKFTSTSKFSRMEIQPITHI